MNDPIERPHHSAGAAFGGLDPRTVVLLFLALSVWISYATDGAALTGGAVVAMICVVIPGSLAKGLMRLGLLLRWSVPFAVLIVVLYILISPAKQDPVFTWGPFVATSSGVRTGVMLGLRFLAFVAAARSLMLYATPSGLAAGITRFLRPLRILGLKPEILYHFTFVTLRLVPSIAAESKTIQFAQRSRGWRPGGRFGMQLRNARMILIPVFAAAMRRADTLSIVLSSRGFHLSGSLPPVDALTFGAMDYVLLIAVTAVAVVGLTFRGM